MQHMGLRESEDLMQAESLDKALRTQEASDKGQSYNKALNSYILIKIFKEHKSLDPWK